MSHTHSVFKGNIPKNYDQFMRPFFEEYALDLAKRAADIKPTSILEIAAGTGIATRYLRDNLSPDIRIIATDLNEEMIKHAQHTLADIQNVEFMTADAMALPFSDNSFDLVICQFGVMFFPDKIAAFKETLRALREGGYFLFNVWDSMEHNEMTATVVEALTTYFPKNPPAFFDVPFGWYQLDDIKSSLRKAGFVDIDFSFQSRMCQYESAYDAAIGHILGTPLNVELTKRNNVSLVDIVSHVTEFIAERFGERPKATRMQAIVVSAVSNK